jgi:hypothetical protein
MYLDLSLALFLDFAQECKRLSVGEFDEPLFSPIICLSVPILIIDLCIIFYHLVNFTVWDLLGRKFVIFINSNFLGLILLLLFSGQFWKFY